MVSEGRSVNAGGARTAAQPDLAVARSGPSRQRLWFGALVTALSVWVILPWLAPLLMELGWELPARGLYWLYSFQCHQMPQRSFFLFDSAAMHSLSELRALGLNTTDPLALRQFVGNADMGYKVAWSDRMVSMYTSLPLAALVWWPLRRRLPPLPWWGLGLFLLPMAIDGGTHVLSDLQGLGQGFRYTNEWLAVITGGGLPQSFYLGNGLGSFNSWMRLITGLQFGIGVMWFTMPHLFSTRRVAREE